MVAQSSKSIDNIQMLRAIAAMLVVLPHIEAITIGAFGVDIFFVISGFVIAYIGCTDTPKSFILKRLFRLVPLYWLGTVTLFAVACIAPDLLNNTTSDPVDLVKSLLFVPYLKGSGLTQPVLFLGWTLNYEMFFYAIFGIALAVRRGSPVIPVTVAICSLVAIGTITDVRDEPFQFWTDPVMLEFVFGVWLFVAWEKGWRVTWSPLLSLATAGVFLAIMASKQHLEQDSMRAFDYGVPAAAIVALALSCEGRLKTPAVLLAIGNASYSLYLLHPYLVVPAQKIVTYITPHPIAMVVAIPLILSVAIALALLSYRFIELPSNLWLRANYLPARRRAAKPDA
jgi:exopolysaccharide production protein ExoZ